MDPGWQNVRSHTNGHNSVLQWTNELKIGRRGLFATPNRLGAVAKPPDKDLSVIHETSVLARIQKPKIARSDDRHSHCWIEVRLSSNTREKNPDLDHGVGSYEQMNF